MLKITLNFLNAQIAVTFSTHIRLKNLNQPIFDKKKRLICAFLIISCSKTNTFIYSQNSLYNKILLTNKQLINLAQ